MSEVEVRLKLRERDVLYSADPISNPEAAVRVMKEALQDTDREMVCVVNLDTHLRPVNYNIVSIGGLDTAMIPVQNVFKAAILSNAASIMLLHTHPSGVAQPSRIDDETTKKLLEACRLMDIPLTDHIIIGCMTGETFSYRTERPGLFMASGLSVSEQGEQYMKEFTFDDFKEHTASLVREELEQRGLAAEVHFIDVRKLNQSYHGISILPEGESASPVFNLDEMYRHYLETGEIDVGQMIHEVEASHDLARLAEKLDDYENVKDSLVIRVSPREGNEDFLEITPHREILDLAVTYHVIVGDRDEGMSTVVTQKMLEHYGISEEQLHQDAVNSSMNLFPARTVPLMDAILGLVGQETILGLPRNEPELWVITNRGGQEGAAAMLYPDVLEQAAEQLGENFYIIPSSRYEVILMPDSMALGSYQELETMIREVNRTEVSKEDRLSDKAYHYEDKSRRLEMAEDFEARKMRMKQKKMQRQKAGVEL
ncbi:MAG: DUF5688 family protein [Eubacterium sp.]|nr:DUF5688 family protein [Eubacterium sp.]